MDIRLDDRHAVVCGASQGIGRATARALARQGASCTLVARDEAALGEVLESLDTTSGQSHGYLIADFDDHAALDRMIAEKLGGLPPVGVLVNNAGGPPGGPIREAESDAFLVPFRRHLLTSQKLVKALLPGMRAGGYGRIINIISTSVKEPIPGLGVSNTVRGAMASWAKTLAGELGPDGITVNNVLPGFTATGRLRSLFEGKAAKLGKTLEEIETEARGRIPLGRFAAPEETADAIAFLASPAAAYITGINLPVDGGRLGCL